MKQCDVETCDSPSQQRHRWCAKHLSRYRRHGDPEKVLTIHQVCTIDGCSNVPTCTRQGICDMHRARISSHGDPDKVIKPSRRSTAGYVAAHRRIRKDRGRAVEYSCVDCAGLAHEWSYNHQDSGQLVSPKGLPYSLDPSYYDPRCTSCHASFDRGWLLERRHAAMART